MEEKRKREPAFSKQENKLKFTKIKASPAINQKNYYTDYLKRESQLLVNREPTPNKEEDKTSAKEEKSKTKEDKTIVIIPGSRNLQIGFIDDASPTVLPMCVARKPHRELSVTRSKNDKKQFDEAYSRLERDFEDRMKFYKREVTPNALKTVQEFNSRQKGQPAVDDQTWTTAPDVSICDLSIDPSEYTLSWPIQNGTLNENYDSVQQLLNDLSLIFDFAVFNELKVNKSNVGEYAVVLVIPDLYEQPVVHCMLDLLVKFTGFGKVAVLQEAVAATFGAGLSAACIVSVGAQSCSIACVDEGMSVLDSRINLKYGGDDITTAFTKMIKRADFPIDLNLDDPVDYKTADSLKKKLCTANDDAIAIQLESVIYTRPEKAQKYDFKIYNEVILPILGLFYPELIFDPPSEKLAKKYSLVPRAENVYDGRYDDPISDAMLNVLYNTLILNDNDYTNEIQVKEDKEADDIEESRQVTPMPPAEGKAAKSAQLEQKKQQIAAESTTVKESSHVALDHAIIQSISQVSAKTGGSPKQFYENILIIGGGAQFMGFDNLLADRLAMWSHKKLPEFGEPSVMALPRELDASTVAWKGATVYSRLKIMDEMWIENQDWATLGYRVLQYKALFAF